MTFSQKIVDRIKRFVQGKELYEACRRYDELLALEPVLEAESMAVREETDQSCRDLEIALENWEPSI